MTRTRNLRTDIRVTKSFVAAVVAVSVLASACGGGSDEEGSSGIASTPNLTQTIQFISEQRSKTEDDARAFINDKDDLCPNQYVPGRNLYRDARAAWNSWLAGLKFAVRTGQSQEIDRLLALLQDQVDSPVAYSEQFRKHANTIARQCDNSPRLIPADVIGIVSGVVNLLFGIREEVERAENAARQKVLTALEEQEWASWQELGG
jgi:hypothetical protein